MSLLAIKYKVLKKEQQYSEKFYMEDDQNQSFLDLFDQFHKFINNAFVDNFDFEEAFNSMGLEFQDYNLFSEYFSNNNFIFTFVNKKSGEQLILNENQIKLKKVKKDCLIVQEMGSYSGLSNFQDSFYKDYKLDTSNPKICINKKEFLEFKKYLKNHDSCFSKDLSEDEFVFISY